MKRWAALVACVLIFAGAARAAEVSKKSWETMDYGGMMTATLESRAVERQITPKAIAIRLGEKGQAYVIFDEDLLRYSVGWAGDFIDWKNIQMDGSHRTWAKVVGDEVWGNAMRPGGGRGSGRIRGRSISARIMIRCRRIGWSAGLGRWRGSGEGIGGAIGMEGG